MTALLDRVSQIIDAVELGSPSQLQLILGG